MQEFRKPYVLLVPRTPEPQPWRPSLPLLDLTPDFAIMLEVGEPTKSRAYVVPLQPISNVILSPG